MQWHAIFNAHFSVPVNFVLFVSLDIFLQLNFVSMNICHFFQLLRRLFCVTIRNLLDDSGISVCFFHPFRVIYWCSGKNVSSISISKYSFNEDFAKLQIKTSILESLFKDIYRPSWCAKDQSPSEVCVRFRHAKESMSKKYQACAKVCACDHIPHMMKFGLVIHVISFCIRNISDSQ